MRIPLLLIGISVALCPGAASAMDDAAFGAPISDGALAQTYGRLLLPNGVDLAMTVQSDTAVDGHLLLRSVFAIDQGTPTLTVFAPAAGTAGPSVTTQVAASDSGDGGAQPGVTVMIDRASGINTIRPTYAGTAPNLNVSVGGSPTVASRPADNADLVQVPTVLGGAPVETGGGAVSTLATTNGYRVSLDGAGLSVNHLAGQAFGTAVANTVSDRTIDSVTTVQLDLRNYESVALGSAAMRVDDLATGAASAMAR